MTIASLLRLASGRLPRICDREWPLSLVAGGWASLPAEDGDRCLTQQTSVHPAMSARRRWTSEDVITIENVPQVDPTQPVKCPLPGLSSGPGRSSSRRCRSTSSRPGYRSSCSRRPGRSRRRAELRARSSCRCWRPPHQPTAANRSTRRVAGGSRVGRASGGEQGDRRS